MDPVSAVVIVRIEGSMAHVSLSGVVWQRLSKEHGNE